MRRVLVWVATMVCLASAASPAHAEEGPGFVVGAQSSWFWLAGLTTGGSFGSPGGGGFLGGELSVVRLRRGTWLGVYGDGAYDFGHGLTTVSVGPELGYAFLGVDGGVGARFGGDAIEYGGQARLLLTAGVFSLFGRYGFWPSSDQGRHVGQVGVLLKLPVMSPWGFGPAPR